MKSSFGARTRLAKDKDVLLVPLTEPEDVFFLLARRLRCGWHTVKVVYHKEDIADDVVQASMGLWRNTGRGVHGRTMNGRRGR